MGEVNSIATLGAAFAAGVLSVASPCVMPLIPAYLSLISGMSVEEIRGGAQEVGVRRRVLTSSFGFVAGFSTIFIALGASATVIGQVLRTWHTEILGVELGMAQVAGAVVVLMGLHLTGLLPIPALYRDRRLQVRRGGRAFLGTYLVGAAFAFGWSPCIGPILGGILTIAGSRDTVWQGVGLLAIYSTGLAVPFLFAGWSIEFFLRAFQRVKRYARAFEAASGVLLIAIGFLVFTEAFARLNSYFAFLNRFVSAAERFLL